MPARVARTLNVLAAAVAGLLLSGCARFAADAEIRFCRSIIPALHHSEAAIEIVEAEASKHAIGTMIKVVYLVAGQRSDAWDGSYDIRCGFAPSTGTNASPELTHLGTSVGVYGDVRLHFLKRFWIASGELAVSDPEPIRGAARARQVPLNIAIMVQHAASTMPMIGIYALLATSYVLIYRLIGRINLAFGEMTILGGYGAFLGFSLIDRNSAGMAVLAAVAVGLVTTMVQGHALGRIVLARLVDRPGQHALIVTLGLAIAGSEAVRLLQGSGTRWMAPLMTAPFALVRADGFVATASTMSMLVALAAMVACALVVVLMRRTSFGRAWRASADDPFAAALCGIDPKQVLVMTVVVAAALAGLAGTLTTLMYGGIGHAGGLTIGLKALVAAVIGGIGSVPGAMIGAVVLGVLESAWSAMFAIESRDVAIFLLLALWLALRPYGIFGVADDRAQWSKQHERAM